MISLPARYSRLVVSAIPVSLILLSSSSSTLVCARPSRLHHREGVLIRRQNITPALLRRGRRVLTAITSSPVGRNELPKHRTGHRSRPSIEMVGAVTEQTNPRWMSWSSNVTRTSNSSYSMVQLAYSSILQSKASHQSLSTKPESTQLLTYEMLMLTVLAALVLVLCVTVVIALSLQSGGKGEGFDESAATKFAGIVPFTGADLDHLLSNIPTDGQDVPPWISGKWLRIKARIEGPVEGGGNICGPLTGRPCVAYEARVSEHSHSGKQALVADAQRSVNFEVSFLDAPNVRVRVAGGCVRMVDIKEGSYANTMSFSDAPEHCQTFALQNALSGTAPWHCGHHLLEFQERALIIGACVTLVGELRRDARGGLTLTALSDNTLVQRRRAPDVERWRTSWECSGLASPDLMNDSSHACSVLVSDSPRLLNGLGCDAGHALMLRASGYALAVA